MAKKQSEIAVAVVDLGDDVYPNADRTYSLVAASDSSLAEGPLPGSPLTMLDLSLISFYVENLPDFGHGNEALLKLTVNTRNPQDDKSKLDISSAVEFGVRDGDYAPGIANRGVFRNVLFRDFVNLGINLIEIDSNFSDGYGKVKDILKSVDGLDTLDVLNGIPYLTIATKLFDGVITAFGKNEDDVVWDNVPLLDLNPGPGSAFLRSGIYVVHELKNQEGAEISHSRLSYRDGRVTFNDVQPPKGGLPNTLILSIRLKVDQRKS